MWGSAHLNDLSTLYQGTYLSQFVPYRYLSTLVHNPKRRPGADPSAALSLQRQPRDRRAFPSATTALPSVPFDLRAVSFLSVNAGMCFPRRFAVSFFQVKETPTLVLWIR